MRITTKVPSREKWPLGKVMQAEVYLRKTNLERHFTEAEEDLVTGWVQEHAGEAGAENSFQIFTRKKIWRTAWQRLLSTNNI